MLHSKKVPHYNSKAEQFTIKLNNLWHLTDGVVELSITNKIYLKFRTHLASCY